jgi:hypothetical protein
VEMVVLHVARQVDGQLLQLLLVPVMVRLLYPRGEVASKVEVERLGRLRVGLDGHDYRPVAAKGRLALAVATRARRLPLAADHGGAGHERRPLGHATVERMQVAYDDVEKRKIKKKIGKRRNTNSTQ